MPFPAVSARGRRTGPLASVLLPGSLALALPSPALTSTTTLPGQRDALQYLPQQARVPGSPEETTSRRVSLQELLRRRQAILFPAAVRASLPVRSVGMHCGWPTRRLVATMSGIRYTGTRSRSQVAYTSRSTRDGAKAVGRQRSLLPWHERSDEHHGSCAAPPLRLRRWQPVHATTRQGVTGGLLTIGLDASGNKATPAFKGGGCANRLER